MTGVDRSPQAGLDEVTPVKKTALERMPWLPPLLAVAASLVAFMACWLHEPLWDVFGVPHIEPGYMDTTAVLSASDASAAGADPYSKPNRFDPMGRPHVYGPWWLELHRLGLARADRVWLGTGLMLLSAGVMAWWLRPRTWRATGVAVLLMASPPVILAFERGNNDLVIFMMLAGAGWFLMKNAAWRTGLAAGVVWLAAALKFYPLVAVLALVAQGGRKRFTGWGAAVVAGFVVVAWIYRTDIARALTVLPAPESLTVYGIKVIAIGWNKLNPMEYWFLGGLLVGGLHWVVLTCRDRRTLPDELAGAFIAGATSWVLCYILNTNYGYRALLLLLPAGAWLRMAQRKEPAGVFRTEVWALAGVLVLFWLRAAHTHMDLIASLTQFRVVSFTLGLENGMALGISLFLVVAGLRWGWNRWRATAAPEARGR
ncbi:hypothetical protein IMCC26134_11940 [Verrucomicrobia bacterium IMCC26134]|nr:hypothetical protein IMCC26134_11940 [Verrucomicrobia bacterium IMCC26134]